MSKSIRVIHVLAPIKLGGGETLLLNLLNEKRNNIDEMILLINRSPEMEKKLLEFQIEFEILSSSVPSQYNTRASTLLNTLFKFFLIPKLVRVLRKKNINIIHLHGFPALLLTILPIVFFKYQSIYTHHSFRKKPKLYEEALLTLIYNKLDLITCVSKTVEKSFKGSFPKLKTKIITIYNCISNLFLDTPAAHEKDDKKFKFIQIARFAPLKNQIFALHELAKLPYNARTQIELFFAGDGPTLDEAKSLARSLKINAHFLGHVPNDQLIPIIDKCDFSLFPSELEGFGIGAVETMARGLPTLAIKIEVMEEIIGEFGLLKDKSSFAEGFQEIINKKFDKNKLKEHTMTYSPSKIKDDYIKFYNRLV